MPEYPKFKAPFEALTTIDERVDYVHNQLVGVQLGLNQLLGKEDMPTMAQVTRGVTIQVTAQSCQGVKISETSPLTGTITEVMPHWPDGCEDPATGVPLVEIAFGHSDTWVYPGEVEKYLALNNVTPVLRISEPVIKGEELWMDVRNGDSVNPHTVSVTLTVIGVE